MFSNNVNKKLNIVYCHTQNPIYIYIIAMCSSWFQQAICNQLETERAFQQLKTKKRGVTLEEEPGDLSSNSEYERLLNM